MDKRILVFCAAFVIFFQGFVPCFQGFAQYQQGILVETLLKTDTTVLGQKINYPEVNDEEVSFCKVTIPPGTFTGWHKHLIPVFAYILQGTLTVELENGSIRSYPSGSTLAEVIGTYHNGSNSTKDDVVLLAIYLGSKDQTLSIKK